jgi:hypothetical protein
MGEVQPPQRGLPHVRVELQKSSHGLPFAYRADIFIFAYRFVYEERRRNAVPPPT